VVKFNLFYTLRDTLAYERGIRLGTAVGPTPTTVMCNVPHWQINTIKVKGCPMQFRRGSPGAEQVHPSTRNSLSEIPNQLWKKGVILFKRMEGGGGGLGLERIQGGFFFFFFFCPRRGPPPLGVVLGGFFTQQPERHWKRGYQAGKRGRGGGGGLGLEAIQGALSCFLSFWPGRRALTPEAGTGDSSNQNPRNVCPLVLSSESRSTEHRADVYKFR